MDRAGSLREGRTTRVKDLALSARSFTHGWISERHLIEDGSVVRDIPTFDVVRVVPDRFTVSVGSLARLHPSTVLNGEQHPLLRLQLTQPLTNDSVEAVEGYWTVVTLDHDDRVITVLVGVPHPEAENDARENVTFLRTPRGSGSQCGTLKKTFDSSNIAGSVSFLESRLGGGGL